VIDILVLLIALVTVGIWTGCAFSNSRQVAREEAMQRELERMRHSIDANLARREADLRRMVGVVIEAIRNNRPSY
jgi:hypothetical protein